MAKRTAGQIFADLVSAGFTAAQATTMTAIALAESGGDDAAVGDVGLQNNTWGPSYGLYQVRTLKADTGRGTDRDINRLAGSPSAQAIAAYHISNGGTNFTPWSVYTSGAYQQYLGQAQGIAASGVANATEVRWGPDWLPWNLPGAAADTASQAVSGARGILLESLAAGLGLGLVAVGLARTVGPSIRRATAQVRKTAAEVVT